MVFCKEISHRPNYNTRQNQIVAKYSDRPRHPSGLMSSLCAHKVAKDISYLQADSEDSDETRHPIWRMPRLIWVFAERTCHFGSFVMLWLKLCLIKPLYTGRLFHCYMLGESICHFRGVMSILSLLFSFWWQILLANTEDLNQTLHYDLGRNCLPMTLLQISK